MYLWVSNISTSTVAEVKWPNFPFIWNQNLQQSNRLLKTCLVSSYASEVIQQHLQHITSPNVLSSFKLQQILKSSIK